MREREGQRQRQRDLSGNHAFYDQTLQIVQEYFHRILFIRSESLSKGVRLGFIF